MTGMANELTERGESLNLEARISFEKENSEPLSDSSSSSTIGASYVGFGDKAS